MAARRFVTFYEELRETLWLAGPVVAAQLAQISMGFVDTVMVGRLGQEALAGVALGNTAFFFGLIVCLGVIQAVGPMVSQAHGAGEHEPVERSVRQGLWLSVVLAVPAVLILWNIAPVLRAAGQPASAVAAAEGYLHAILGGFLPALWFMALRSFVEGLARPFPVTIITFVGVALNVGAMLLAFIALIAVINWLLGGVGTLTGLNSTVAEASDGRFDGLTLQAVFGFVFAPLAWAMGVESASGPSSSGPTRSAALPTFPPSPSKSEASAASRPRGAAKSPRSVSGPCSAALSPPG